MVNVSEVNLPDPNSLFASVSVPSISFKDSKIGDSFTGTITALETAQVRDFDSNEPKFWDDGKPQLQVVLTLDTEYTDPTNSEDDGTRKLYLVLSLSPSLVRSRTLTSVSTPPSCTA
jgi:hypothetical protein